MKKYLILLAFLGFCSHAFSDIRIVIKDNQPVYYSGKNVVFDAEFENKGKDSIWVVGDYLYSEERWTLKIKCIDGDEKDRKEILDKPYKYRGAYEGFREIGTEKIEIEISKASDESITKLSPGRYDVYIELNEVENGIKQKKDNKLVPLFDKDVKVIKSNAIKLIVADKALQQFLEQNPESDANKDGLLSQKEKEDYIEKQNKQGKYFAE